MQPRQYLQPCVMVLLAVTATAAWAQTRPCSQVPPAEREFARATGACRDVAPIIDVVPKGIEFAPPVITPVPNVVGLSFDEARDRLAGFTLRRSYRPSAEPGGTVLEQQPAPPARVAAGAIVRVVLSDATLRPAPRVAASDIDGVPQSAAVTEAPSPAVRIEQPNSAVQSGAPAGRAEVERLRVPNVIGMPIKSAQARLSRFKVQRSERPSQAPVGRVIGQVPKAAARATAGQAIVLVVSSGPASPSEPARAVATPVAETFELPNVIGRSSADASAVLAEFKVDRIEVVASGAPSGQVLAQYPAPGTGVPPGSAIALQVSDGSLANAATTTPADPSPPSPATPPVQTPTDASASTPPLVQSGRLPVASANNAALIVLAVVLLGLVLGALLMRRRLLGREPAVDVETAAPVEVAPAGVAPAEIHRSGMPVPEIRVAARLDAGETTIEFTAPLEADETTLEHSRELHE